MIKDQLNRSSVRDFKPGRELSKKEMATITKVINNSPTSVNQQQFSAIFVNDKQIKEGFAKLNWNQQHIKDAITFIIFVADNTRIKYSLSKKGKKMPASIREHEYVRGITDATIAATYAQDALIEMGFGVTFVGGVLSYIPEIKAKLNLPDSLIPVVALSVGDIKVKNAVKPKINKVYINTYNQELVEAEVQKYSDEHEEYFKKVDKYDFITYNSVAMSHPRYINMFKRASKQLNKSRKNYK